MASILILPLIAFAAGGSGGSPRGGDVASARVFNGSEVVMSCPPAEMLVRTHMAPDFEQPQLVRRLDWFQGGMLVASFQQDVLTDISQQWWVASTRLELRKPFYQLRISPVMSHDSGDYECRLETDPLFAMDTPTAVTRLIVMVKPVAPAKPQFGAFSDRSVTLHWNQSVAAAHKPIVRYSVMFGRLDDLDSVRVMSTSNNVTSAVIEGLAPNTEYSFSVRAENLAGESEFGPELVFKTSGQAPRVAPIITSTRNASSVGCVEVEWKLAETEGGGIVGYRIMVHRVGDGAMREWYARGKKRRHLLCTLSPFASYTLSLESDNTFGYSPPATTNFKTDQAAPAGPPQLISVRTLGHDAVMVQWQEPSVPNGVITSYQIYYRELNGGSDMHSHHPTMIRGPYIRLLIGGGEKSKSFAYNITKLAPSTQYRLRMSASTAAGESEKSAAVEFRTDRPAPFAPTITGVFYDCVANRSAVRLSWIDELNHVVPVVYKVALTWGKWRHAVYNTSERELVLPELVEKVNYTVRVAALVESMVDVGRMLDGPRSPSEVFSFQRDACKLASSLCNEEAANCLLIATGLEDADGESLSASSLLIDRSPVSLLLLLSGVLITVSASLLFTWYIRRRCSLVKDFIGKVECKKGGGGAGTVDTQPEIISLVNDSLEPIYGQTVTIAKFNDYCSSLAACSNEGYRSQFQELAFDTAAAGEEMGSMNSQEEDSVAGAEGRSKNRYFNIQAVEHSRIRIRDFTITDDTSDGYINANYIDSCDSKNAYIATQAPLPHTLADFWAMVWQEECNLVISLTNMVEGGKRKCDRYWPSTKQKAGLQFGQLRVTLSAEHVNSVFVHRIMELRLLTTKDQSGNDTPWRVVHQLHFTSWNDHSVPGSPFPFLYFLNYASEIHSTGPVVVHCSAGVGRSGSFILIDSMRRHLLQCDRINIQAHLRRVRRQRSRLVQTLEQYIFCHDVLCTLVRHGITRQPLLNYSKYVNFLFRQRLADGRTRLQMQYEDACKCTHSPACPQSPNVRHVALPGYHLPDEFIVGSWPAPCEELWSACWEFRCRSMVLVSEDDGGCDYLAGCERADGNGLPAMSRRRFMGTVSRRSSTQLTLTNGAGSSAEELEVTIVCVRETDLRSNAWKEIERIQANSLHDENTISRTLVVDTRHSDSAFALCALQSIACQLEQERYCDLLLYLTRYHHISCGCWSSQATVEFIYAKILQLVEARRHS